MVCRRRRRRRHRSRRAACRLRPRTARGGGSWRVDCERALRVLEVLDRGVVLVVEDGCLLLLGGQRALYLADLRLGRVDLGLVRCRPRKGGRGRRAGIRSGDREEQRADEPGGHGRREGLGPPADSAPTIHCTHGASVTGAWLQNRHPVVSFGLRPEFGVTVTFATNGERRIDTIDLAAAIHRVPVHEGSRVGRSGSAPRCVAGGSVVVLRHPLCQAPVGGLRWRPPLPPPTWSEIRDASTFGPIAPQSVAVPGITSPSDPETSEPHSEDCLSLNIWTPELPASSGAETRQGQTRHGVHPRGRASPRAAVRCSLTGAATWCATATPWW